MAKRPSPIAVIEKLIDVQDRIGEFVANGPDTGLGGHVRNEYRKRCNQFANLPGWATALNPGARGTMGRICTPYWDAQGVDGPIEQVPFTGGQCPGLSYTVGFKAPPPASRGDWTIVRSGAGPVALVSQNTVPRESFPNNRATTYIFSFSGVQQTATLFHPADVSPGFLLVTSDVNASDNCGDPPSDLEPGPVPPPNPGPTPGPEPTENPDDPTGVPLLPVPPFDDPLGGPTPIEAEDDPTSGIDPTDIPGNTDSQEGGAENIGEPIAGEVGPDGSGDDIDFGEPPDGRVWVGCLLQFAIPPAYGIIPNSSPSNPVAARIFGNASLVFSNGRGTPHRLNGANIDLFRPSGALKVTGVFVNSLPGITYNVRPVSILKCPENACAPEE